MTKTNYHRGSAILVVLGMLAFMIASAIAFSAYMRYSRLPSSYLRRTAASRQLVKAALAEAIDEVDRALCNNPHPGVGTKTIASSNRNHWVGRVFTGVQNLPRENGATVPVMTLESLAYLPPSLVNDARYYSRLTPTAEWRSFAFDAGRYAYCAVDVSDYFDVNRVTAGEPRSSSSNRRVSLAHLFENTDHTSAGSGGDAWDTWMENYRKINEDTFELEYGEKTPFVSMADFNLALGKNGPIGSMKSHFYDYLASSAGQDFYGSGRDNREAARRMTFVTDSYTPTVITNTTESIDLADGKDQPFDSTKLEGGNARRGQVMSGSGLQNRKEYWLRHLSGAGVAALWDYLDPDRKPLSLSLATMERVPMICGIQPVLPGSQLTVVRDPEEIKDDDVNVISGDEKTRTVQKTVTFKIGGGPFVKGFLGGKLRVLVAFPYNRKDPQDPGSYKVDGRLSFVFSTEKLGLRTSENDVLHLADKTMPTAATAMLSGVVGGKGETDIAFSVDGTQEGALKIVDLDLSEGQGLAEYFNTNPLLTLKYEWTQTKAASPAGNPMANAEWEPKWSDVYADPKAVGGGGSALKFVSCGIRPVDANGKLVEEFSSAKLLDVLNGNPNWERTLHLQAAVWVRLRQGNDVVDMVPACFRDDVHQQLSQNDNTIPPEMIRNYDRDYPLLKFSTAGGRDTDHSFTFSIKGLTEMGTKEIALYPSTVICSDPRFNHAPEHWFKSPSENLQIASWLQENQMGQGGRQKDIFFATSDAGYLQSKYELAFIPPYTDLENFGNNVFFGNTQQIPAGHGNTALAESFGQTVNRNLMWYSFDPTGEDEENFKRMDIVNGRNGLRINPYSTETNIIIAALANTPVDWAHASTNLVGRDKRKPDFANMNAAQFNAKYAWNEYSSDQTHKITWDELSDIAGEFIGRMRNIGNDSWENIWNDMDWSYKKDSFCGVPLEDQTAKNLWTADRKFLYGFWRDCFGSRQQLFLVFVRAEPGMMGSGAMSKVPPQLGGRAVALVWRDPTENNTSGSDGKQSGVGYPHKTRVLFYKHLD